jgi:hypothetical protein
MASLCRILKVCTVILRKYATFIKVISFKTIILHSRFVKTVYICSFDSDNKKNSTGRHLKFGTRLVHNRSVQVCCVCC